MSLSLAIHNGHSLSTSLERGILESIARVFFVSHFGSWMDLPVQRSESMRTANIVHSGSSQLSRVKHILA